MKKLIVILLIILLHSVGWAATYYVCPGTGAGDKSGSSSANCIADLDGLDAINPSTGTHTIVFADSSGDPTNFTDHGSDFDSWTGSYGLTIDLNGSTFNCNNIGGALFDLDEDLETWTITSLTIKDGYLEGHDGPAGYTFINIDDIDDVTIDNVDINGHLNGSNHATGAWGIRIRKPNGTVTIKNCLLQNLGPKPISYAEVFGIYVDNSSSTNLQIHDNIIHDIGADGMQLKAVYDSSNRGAIYNNVIYDCYEEGIDLKGASYVDVKWNEFYRTGDLGDPDALLQLLSSQTEQGGYSTSYVDVFQNYFHTNVEYYAIQMGTSSWSSPYHDVNNITVRENYITGCAGFLSLSYPVTILDVYNNQVAETNGADSDGIIRINTDRAGNKFRSNSIYSTENTVGFQINSGYSNADTIVEANAFNLTHASAYAFYDENGTAKFTPDWNTWITGGNEVYRNGGVEGSLANNSWEDPQFNSVPSDLSLTETSNARGNAGGSNHSTNGLKDGSEWTPTFNILTIARDSSPDAGAYEYDETPTSGSIIDGVSF